MQNQEHFIKPRNGFRPLVILNDSCLISILIKWKSTNYEFEFNGDFEIKIDSFETVVNAEGVLTGDLDMFTGEISIDPKWPQMSLPGPINFNFRFKLHCGLDRSNRKWLFHLCSIWINAGGWSYCRSSTCYMRFCARPYWKYGSYRLGFHFIDLLRIQH